MSENVNGNESGNGVGSANDYDYDYGSGIVIRNDDDMENDYGNENGNAYDDGRSKLEVGCDSHDEEEENVSANASVTE